MNQIISQLDLFCVNYNFIFNGKQLFSSTIGGIFSFTFLMLFALFGIYLGQELILLQKPTDNLTIKVDLLPLNKTFNIPTAFLIEDEKGNSFNKKINQYLSIDTRLISSNNTLGDFKVIENNSIPMRFCNERDFSEEIKKSYYDMALDDANCMDNQRNLLIGGDFSGNYVRYINVTITPCENSTSKLDCASEREIEAFLESKEYMIALHHESLSYDPSNFSSPIQKFLQEDDYHIDKNFCKVYYYYVEKFIVYSTYGMVISKTDIDVYYVYDLIKFDLTLNTKSDKCLFKFYFLSSSNTRIQTRIYISLSTIIAQIGGSFSITLLFFDKIFKTVYRNKMNEKILRILFQDTSVENYEATIVSLRNKIKRSSSFFGEQAVAPNSTSVEHSGALSNKMNFIQKTPHLPQDQSQLKIKSIRKMLALKDEDTLILSKFKKGIFRHFISYYCFCLLTKKSKLVIHGFNELLKFCNEYLDIISIVNKLYEVEKIKYVLFNKKELALFNLISQPNNPVNSRTDNSLITMMLKYDRNYDNQKVKILEIVKNLKEFVKEKKSRKLVEFCCNLKVDDLLFN